MVDLLFISSDACDVACGDVAEGQRRADVDAAGGIVAAHDAGHVAARRIQPGNGLTRVIQHLGVRVDLEPGERAEAARLDFHGVKRTLFDRRDTRVGLLQGVTLFAVVGRRAATELRIFAMACMTVVVRHGRAQADGIDAASRRQFLKGVAGFQIAAADKGRQRHWKRPRDAQAIPPLKAMVADQPGGDLLTLRGGGDHGCHVVVVTVGFVDEALAVAQDADDSGLAALDDVREMADAAVAVRHLRNRCPGHGGGHVDIHFGANAFAQSQAIAGHAERRQGQVLMPGRRARKQRFAPFDVIGKTAGCEHHAPACMDAHRAVGGADDRPLHLIVLAQQLCDRRRLPKQHAKVFGRLCQTRHQGHAVDQLHGATVHDEVEQVTAKAPGDVPGRRQRAGQVEECRKVCTGHDWHAHEGCFPHGFTQTLKQFADLSCVVGRRDH
ncbi:hypothetical protein D3C87_1247820 [compost metagenome]